MEDKKFVLKLKKKHPRNLFRLGRHSITPLFKAYGLNASEEKELESKGCKVWIAKKEIKKK